MTLRTSARSVFVFVLLALGGCSKDAKVNSANDVATSQTAGASSSVSGDPRCNGNVAGHEVSEYDTSGDDIPDVRKVFNAVGDVGSPRLVLICRENDVNSDGRKDVVRYYDDEGRSLREEADRNFDGKMDSITVFQNGEIVRVELDENYDGKIDTKTFFDAGKPLRAERDMSGRSTETQWHPDRWEYFEGGRMVRMGTDLDGDSRVDHWDRDAAWKRQQEAENTPTAAAPDSGS